MNLKQLVDMMGTLSIFPKTHLNLIPSENCLSPLARIPYLLDIQSRYYLDDLRQFGQFVFPSGMEIEKIIEGMLYPCLKKLTAADYIDARPLSGLSAMTISIAALTAPNDVVFSISPADGGHASTERVVTSMSRTTVYMPFAGLDMLDIPALEKLIINHRPALIYVDQSTFLTPIDPTSIIKLIQHHSPKTKIAYDISHTGGLVFGKNIKNPLDQGADLLCGSTHKTFPGPHKGFICTRAKELYQKIQKSTDHFVSHPNTGSMLSLAITASEFVNCDGKKYSHQIVVNANLFSTLLKEHGFTVALPESNSNLVHQVWFRHEAINTNDLFYKLCQAGILVNRVDCFPGDFGSGLRSSLAEITKLGGEAEHVEALVKLIKNIAVGKKDFNYYLNETEQQRSRLKKPQYCYETIDFGVERFLQFLR